MMCPVSVDLIRISGRLQEATGEVVKAVYMVRGVNTSYFETV